MKWERAEKMFAHSGLSLTEGQFHQFSTYQEILVETNRRMNLNHHGRCRSLEKTFSGQLSAVSVC